jgi:hypothetical protein
MKTFHVSAVSLFWACFLLASCATPTAPATVATPAMSLSLPTSTKESTPVSKALTLDYPRLGMWWPDLSTQSLVDVARYDWIILGDWDSDSVDDLKKLNPDILLLNSTNACELSFDPDADNISEPWANADILKIPPQWFLTQVGSTLTEEVDAISTTLHVAAVTASDGINTYDLFIPGDAVLIDGESALVTAVDAASLTLTVQRGYVRPASGHPAGTRIAAHISFWPHSWLLNLSTLSPLATVDEGIGPENWISYHARTDAALLGSAVWDGLLIDRSDPNESWLIGNSTARTIDPDQSNTLIGDYSAFDAAWNEGLREYETELRQLIGPDKILYVNWGAPNYDLLNGNNFEGFPGDITDAESAGNWYGLVFGPNAASGSYFEWMANALQPNLTMIETYEDNGGPEATSDGSYDNPCIKKNFTPDYRKMRFGLTTALLNDGFFSYEMNTNGHGSLCLMWFDEYDNAGAGRGYLGQPLGTAYPAMTGEESTVIFTSDFSDPASQDVWELWADEEVGNSANLLLEDGAARIDIGAANGEDWQVSLLAYNVPLETGAEYTLTFSARADVERPLTAWLQMDHDPWTTWLYFDESALTTNWQQFTLTGIAGGTDNAAQLIFGLGQQTGTVWIKDITLKKAGLPVYRRDFEGGVVIVNASSQPQTIDLGGTYVKIDGTQDRSVNDGSVVTSVTVCAYDGVILLVK